MKALLEAHDRDARQSDLRCVPMPAADWLMMRCDPKGLDSAVEDWEYVQFLFPNNSASLFHEVSVLSAAIELAKSQGRQDDVTRYSDMGRQIVPRLETMNDYLAGEWSCWGFYRAIGDEDQAWQAIRRVGAPCQRIQLAIRSRVFAKVRL